MTDIAVRDALDEAATAAGLRIDPTFGEDDLAGLEGPLITMNVPSTAGEGISAVVALRDGPDGDDELLATLADAAATGAIGGPEPVAGEPVMTGAEIEARFTTPFVVAGLSDGTDIQAVVVHALDRRQSGGDSADAGTADPGAASSGSDGVQPAPAPTSTPAPTPGSVTSAVAGQLDKLVNVELSISVELGRAQVTLADVLGYDVGSVIELDRAAGSPVDVRVNGMLLAQGDVVLIDDEYAVRITAVFDPQAGQ